MARSAKLKSRSRSWKSENGFSYSLLHYRPCSYSCLLSISISPRVSLIVSHNIIIWQFIIAFIWDHQLSYDLHNTRFYSFCLILPHLLLLYLLLAFISLFSKSLRRHQYHINLNRIDDTLFHFYLSCFFCTDCDTMTTPECCGVWCPSHQPSISPLLSTQPSSVSYYHLYHHHEPYHHQSLTPLAKCR